MLEASWKTMVLITKTRRSEDPEVFTSTFVREDESANSSEHGSSFFGGLMYEISLLRLLAIELWRVWIEKR